VVADHVPVAARRARDQHRPPVVPLLGHAVPRARAARPAGEGQFVVRLLEDVGGPGRGGGGGCFRVW
jgi:hypothetical protein